MNNQQTLLLEKLAEKGTADEAYLFDCINHEYREYQPRDFAVDLEELLAVDEPQIERGEGTWLTFMGGEI